MEYFQVVYRTSEYGEFEINVIYTIFFESTRVFRRNKRGEFNSIIYVYISIYKE